MLLNRTTRRVSLTEEGSWSHQRAVKILTEMSEAEGLLLMRREQPEGILRVDAATPSSCMIGAHHRRFSPPPPRHRAANCTASEGFINP